MSVRPARTRRLAAAAGLAVLTGTAVISLPGAASATACPVLQTGTVIDRGDRGSAVSAVQCALRVGMGLEFADLAVDGIFGPATLTAVTALQARSGLRVDGVVGPLTYRALAGALAAPVPDGDQQFTADGPTLRRGDLGPQVRVLQQALGVSADGRFGPLTEQAVAAFQGREGLLVDGVCGPLTRRALVDHGVDGY